MPNNKNGPEDQPVTHEAVQQDQITPAALGPLLSSTVTGQPLGHLNASATGIDTIDFAD